MRDLFTDVEPEIADTDSTASIVCADALEFLTSLPANAAHLIIGSPPYPEKGERYIGRPQKWPTLEWVAWMVKITEQAVRASAGYVLWVVNGAVKDGRYHPACELLVADCYRQGITCERPCIWHKNAPPNRKDWFGNDWEFILAFRKEQSTGTFNWEAIAQPPKYTSGGRFRQRSTNGHRRLGNEYPTNKLARPRDVLRVTVGGGHLGSKLAHQNEAPYPEKLVEPFVFALTSATEMVIDPFSGSGTTAAVALRHGRCFQGCDNRLEQVELTRRRISEVNQAVFAPSLPPGAAVEEPVNEPNFNPRSLDPPTNE
jgi:DNA modification methylase